MTKARFRLLERLFEAEYQGHLPLQSKSAKFLMLASEGLIQPYSRRIGRGWSAVTVSGWRLTDKGRYEYCAACRDVVGE